MILLFIAFTSFSGSVLLLSQFRWFQHSSISRRIAPYVPNGDTAPSGDPFSADSLLEIVGPLAQTFGARLTKFLGISEETSLRLIRIHSPLGIVSYRIRQFAWSLAALGGATLVAVGFALPPPMSIAVVLGAPLTGFVLVEHRLAQASADWQRRTALELPIVAEQLGMLLDAGFSLGGALSRLARRSSGVVAADLTRLVERMHHGLAEVDALREWAAIVAVEPVDRLVAVLAVHGWSGNAGRVLDHEAQAIRREAHRSLVADIARRGQQVWIPVTVAALVPGVMLMGVPFIDALTLFTQ